MSNLHDLDREDQALLNSLQPEGALPGSDPNEIPTDEGTTAAPALDAAPAAAAPSPAPAAPAPAPATEATAPAPAPAAGAPAPSPAPATQAEQGDVRGALRASRRNERRLRDEIAARDAELEELRKKVGTPANEPDAADYTEEQLADLKENFPLQYRMVMDLRELKQRVPAPAAAPAPATEWEAPVYDPRVQEVIDQVPQLQAWQYSQADQPKFDMAAQYDEALRHDPDWKTRTPVERFSEAVRRTQQRFAAAPAPAPAQDPAALAAARIAAAPAHAPAAIHDFRGGGPAAAPGVDFNRMSDEAILGSLVPEP